MRYFMALVLVVVGWLYWDARIPGIPLLSPQVDRFLDPGQEPRRILKALDQVQGTHPGLAPLSGHPDPRVRARVARIDPSFRFLEDQSPWVRLQAALGMGGSEPQIARPVLLRYLRPLPVFATQTGHVFPLAAAGREVKADAPLLRVGEVTIPSPLPGRVVRWYVEPDEWIVAGQRLVELELPERILISVVEVLGQVGAPPDMSELRLLTKEQYPEGVRRAAGEALRQIESRGRKKI